MSEHKQAGQRVVQDQNVQRYGYLGPEGTFTHQALLASAVTANYRPVALATIHETVMAVQSGAVERALVPFENSLEGSVNVTLDALVFEAPQVTIIGEVVLPVEHCLAVRPGTSLEQITEVISHPQAIGQCARFIRERLPQATVTAASSTAEAVRLISLTDRPQAAIANRLAAELYGCEVLCEGIEDQEGNQTRFIWLAPQGSAVDRGESFKTSLVFWGSDAGEAGWLVRCLSEFAFRGVNLTKIESRPRKDGLGSYMFFIDLEGALSDPPVAEAVAGLKAHVQQLRVLGSYPT